MKENILGGIVSIIYGALIGLTIGVTDAFLNMPFDPYLFFTAW